MKIRNGFVSNSSSSSFIVAFDKLPQSVKEMENCMRDDYSYGTLKCEIDSDLPKDKVASILFDNCKGIDYYLIDITQKLSNPDWEAYNFELDIFTPEEILVSANAYFLSDVLIVDEIQLRKYIAALPVEKKLELLRIMCEKKFCKDKELAIIELGNDVQMGTAWLEEDIDMILDVQKVFCHH